MNGLRTCDRFRILNKSVNTFLLHKCVYNVHGDNGIAIFQHISDFSISETNTDCFEIYVPYGYRYGTYFEPICVRF